MYSLYFSIGLLVRVLVGLMGIGGGVLLVPAMVYILRMDQHVALWKSSPALEHLELTDRMGSWSWQAGRRQLASTGRREQLREPVS